MTGGQPESERTAARTGDRVAAIVLLVLAIAYGIGATRIEYAFSSDPLGPQAVPVGLAVILALLSLIYLAMPGTGEPWPLGRSLAAVLGVPAVTAAAVVLMEPLGFPIAIFVLTGGVARLFGARWRVAAVAGVCHAAGWWIVFGLLLGVYLPMGPFGR